MSYTDALVSISVLNINVLVTTVLMISSIIALLAGSCTVSDVSTDTVHDSQSFECGYVSSAATSANVAAIWISVILIVIFEAELTAILVPFASEYSCNDCLYLIYMAIIGALTAIDLTVT